MGMVYRVRDRELDRELALKVMLRYHPGPEHRRRFVPRRAEVAGDSFEHPVGSRRSTRSARCRTGRS